MAQKPIIILIAGGSCSGKSYIARVIQKKYPQSTLISLDWYYKKKDWTHSEELERIEALDLDLLTENLEDLISTGSCEAPIYDFVTSCRQKEKRPLIVNPVIIIEGLYAFAILDSCSLLFRAELKIFVEASERTMLQRRMSRDISRKEKSPEAIKNNFNSVVLPAYHSYISHQKEKADICLLNDSENLPEVKDIWDFFQSHFK